jgi:hypothetical protein
VLLINKETAPIGDVAIIKKDLSERDICSKFIGPAVKRAGWDGMMQIREEVAFPKGRIVVRGSDPLPAVTMFLWTTPNVTECILKSRKKPWPKNSPQNESK